MCKTFTLHSQVGADGSLLLTLTLCPRVSALLSSSPLYLQVFIPSPSAKTAQITWRIRCKTLWNSRCDVDSGGVSAPLPRCGTPPCTCCTSGAAGTLVVLMTGKWVWFDLYGGKLLAACRYRPHPLPLHSLPLSLWMRVYIGSEATVCGSLRKREAASAREVSALWRKLDPLLNGGAQLVLKRKQAAALSFPSFRICWVLSFSSSVVVFCALAKWFGSVSNSGFNTVISRSV